MKKCILGFHFEMSRILLLRHAENGRKSSSFSCHTSSLDKWVIIHDEKNPILSMYGIFNYIFHKNQPNVGKYTIHGWYGFIISTLLLLTNHIQIEPLLLLDFRHIHLCGRNAWCVSCQHQSGHRQTSEKARS